MVVWHFRGIIKGSLSFATIKYRQFSCLIKCHLHLLSVVFAFHDWGALVPLWFRSGCVVSRGAASAMVHMPRRVWNT
jgi:hypothetical protein